MARVDDIFNDQDVAPFYVAAHIHYQPDSAAGDTAILIT